MSDNQPIESLRASGSVSPDSANPDELLFALEAAKSGNEPEVAKELMAEMLRQLRAGSRTIYPYVENWVIHAFAKILEDDWKADQAFGLKARQGMYARPNTYDRDIIATAIVILDMRSKVDWLDAVGNAANLLFEDGRGDKAVEAAYSKYHEALQLMPSEALAALIPK